MKGTSVKKIGVSTGTFIAVVFVAGATVFAWTGPTGTAPANNTASPIDVSATSQTKAGNLSVGTLSASSVGATVGFCIGASCITSWPSGGTSQWTTSGSNIYYNTGNVGIGTASPAVGLEVAQNKAIKVGQAYLSSGGDYVMLANNEWYNGSAWNTNAVGALLILSGQTFTFYRHDAAGNHTVEATLDSSANLNLTGNLTVTGGVISGFSGGGQVGSGVGVGYYFDGTNLAVRSPSTGGSTYFQTPNGAATYAVIGAGANGIADYGVLGVNGLTTLSAGLNLTGRMNHTGPTGDWAEVINWGPGSVNGYGILVGTGAGKYSQFQNAEGYYTILDNTSWGVQTNANILASAIYGSAFYYNSDRRLKKNIEPIPNDTALNDILSLNGVTFDWIDPKAGAGKQVGFIAQEVEKVVPELVTTDASTTMKAVDYARVTALLVNAMKEQQGTITKQQSQIDTLQKEVDALKATH